MTCLFMDFTNTRGRLATQVQFHGLSPRARLTLPPYRVRCARFPRTPHPIPLPIRWGSDGERVASGRVRGIRASHQLGCGVELRPVHADGFAADENAVCKAL